MDIAHGSLGVGLSHDFDKARFLTGRDFSHIVSQIAPLTIKSDGDFPIDGGSHICTWRNSMMDYLGLFDSL
jgi:hypothetical protein